MVITQRTAGLKGELTVPGDKSISHRAIILGAIAKGTTEIDGFLMGEDCLSTIECFRKMSVSIDILPNNKVRVNGNGIQGLKPPLSNLNTGKSGTTIRLLLGVLCGQPFSSVVVRDESVQRKSVGRIVKPLKKMGANISGREDGNLCPLYISPAMLQGMSHFLPITDIPVKSSIIIAGMYAEGETTVIEPIRSRDHTELMLNYLGASIQVEGLNVKCNKVDELYAGHIQIPGDISIASYFLTAGLFVPNSDITIKNVGINPTRTGILDVYKSMGANIEIQNERTYNNEKFADIRVTSSSLKGTLIEGDIVQTLVDEIPIITVAAVMAEGTTTINNLKDLKIKQSNKIKNLVTELSKMGASIQETEDSLVINGGRPLKGTVIESNNDYSIAMSMSIAALVADDETMIRKAQILDIAYPNFLPVLNKL